MKAMILAAGQGTRLNDLTKHTPKCIIKIGEKTILEHQIKTLKDYGIDDTFLVIGTKGGVWNQKAYELVKEICKKENIKIVLKEVE
jgi:NDP-sugar pyrophosphorylase family protein